VSAIRSVLLKRTIRSVYQTNAPSPAKKIHSMVRSPRAKLASEIASALGRSSDLFQRLELLVELAPSPVVFTTSFGVEDQIVTHVIATSRLPVELVTLDTGRLFPETISLWARTERHYGIVVRPFVPEALSTQAVMARWGVEGFKASVEARQACCHVRKVAPLAMALAEARAWITGLRATQSRARGHVTLAAWDEIHGLVKANPLADWSREAVAAFATEHDVPVSELHAKGFASIGCAPCTRALAPGEPERAGRWWWEEQEGKKECGLHLPAHPIADISTPA
jgi:phosphoadenosine phosphosulfate reductase